MDQSLIKDATIMKNMPAGIWMIPFSTCSIIVMIVCPFLYFFWWMGTLLTPQKADHLFYLINDYERIINECDLRWCTSAGNPLDCSVVMLIDTYTYFVYWKMIWLRAIRHSFQLHGFHAFNSKCRRI